MTTSQSVDPPIRHSPAFRWRRFLNWFPLGVLYALYYMGRYNVSVASHDICDLYGWTNAQWGLVITAGFWTYAASFLINGPLTDRFGGKKAILVGGVGTAAINAVLGAMIGFGFATKILIAFSLLYAVNMYFQSFGATSIVKVNAAWFHVRERGVFGGIFGILISLGYQLAYGVGGILLATLPLAWVFLVPAACILALVLVDAFVIKDTPEQAGFPRLETGDASSGEDENERVSVGKVLRRILTDRVIVTVALAEFCTGIIRNGTMQWLPKFVQEEFRVETAHRLDLSVLLNPAQWSPVTLYGTGLFLAGIVGGLTAGIISDKVFGSRRPPVAFIFYICTAVGLVVLANVHSVGLVVGAGVLVSFFFIGIHGLLSGTASMDFGGKKAAATAAGLIDGFVYFGSGLAGVPLGYAIDRLGWGAWAYLLVLPALIGCVLTGILWNARPKPKARPA